MKTDEEILEEGVDIAGYGNGENYHRLIISNGQIYPFLGGKMLNPLDPVALLCSICQVGENDDTDEVIDWATRICKTVEEAYKIRSRGYSIVTRQKSGAPRVILDSVTNNVIILGELCSKKGLILHILSTQLADDNYRQDNIAVWKERGFETPQKYDVSHSVSTWDDPDVGMDYTWRQRTLESWTFGGYCFSIIKEEAEMMEVSSRDDRDFDYEGVEEEYFRIEYSEDRKRNASTVPNKTERPEFVWQDKGVNDED